MVKKTKCVGNWILQGVIIFSLNQTQRGAIYKAFTSYHQRFWKWGKWEISFKSKIITLYKSIKYSYFWSFSGYGEENKMFWKLNFTANMMIFHQYMYSITIVQSIVRACLQICHSRSRTETVGWYIWWGWRWEKGWCNKFSEQCSQDLFTFKPVMLWRNSLMIMTMNIEEQD